MAKGKKMVSEKEFSAYKKADAKQDVKMDKKIVKQAMKGKKK